MFEGLKHRLAGGAPVLSRTVSAFLPEGAIAKGLGALQDRYPALEIGSYPFFRQGKFGTSLVLRGTEPATLAAAPHEPRTPIPSPYTEPLKPAPDRPHHHTQPPPRQ